MISLQSFLKKLPTNADSYTKGYINNLPYKFKFIYTHVDEGQLQAAVNSNPLAMMFS